jgi:hypothetical protein
MFVAGAAAQTVNQLGIGTAFPYIADELNIHYALPPLGQLVNPPFPAIKLSFSDINPPTGENPNVQYYHSLTLAIAPADGDFGAKRGDGLINISSGDLLIGTTKAPHDPWAYLNPNNDGGAIRFKTVPSTSDRKSYERFTILNNGNIGIDCPNPYTIFQIGDRLLFDPGPAPQMKFNSAWVIAGERGTRLFDGVAAGCKFWSTSNPKSIIGKRMESGGVMLYADEWNAQNKGFSDHDNYFELRNAKLVLWNAGNDNAGAFNGQQFEIVNDIPADTFEDSTGKHFTPAKGGWGYFKHKLLIGTTGKPDQTFMEPNPNNWSEETGDIYLTGLNVSPGIPLMLAANGLILCKDILVAKGSPIPWPDYVFQENYQLMPLADLEKVVKKTGHLPEMPSAGEIEKGGINVTDLETKLLKKVEELTLYVIDLKKENILLREKVDRIESKSILEK